MHWSDERYVKLYSRDTPGWMLWPWQARALLPLLLRRLDGAGVLECGRARPVDAVAIVVGLPIEVVNVGLEALLSDGVLESIERGLLMPNYIEAQEATKTEAGKKRDQRERHRAQARVTVKAPVPECPVVSPSVPECPPPAYPSPAQPSPAQGSATQRRSRSVEKTTDPRHAPLVKFLCSAFEEIRGIAYPFKPRDAASVRDLLAAAEPEVISHAWVRALRHGGFPTVSTLAELHQNLAHFVGTGPPPPRVAPFDPNQGIIRSGGVDREDPFPWTR